MTAPLTLGAGHSHIFAGAWLTADRAPDPGESGEEAMVEFADGVAAPARLLPMPGPRLRLEVSPHVTARGTAIPARPWVAEQAEDPRRLKIRMSAETPGGD